MNILLKKGDKGAEVVLLQKALTRVGLPVYHDGVFGPITEEAVMAYQRKMGLKVDGIVGAATWAALIPFTITKSKRNIKEIIVHCSDTPEGRHHTVADIRTWHKAKGWNDIGYHYVVYIDGSIHNGRSVDISGAHCSGHNSNSIGVCYVGGCEGEVKNGKIVPKTDKNGYHIAKDTRTWEQKKSLVYLLKELRTLYPKAKIYGHHDFDKGKACPSFDAKAEYKDI